MPINFYQNTLDVGLEESAKLHCTHKPLWSQNITICQCLEYPFIPAPGGDVTFAISAVTRDVDYAEYKRTFLVAIA